MTIPALPFDSLYKFLFAGGLILVVLASFSLNRNSELRNADFLKIDSLLYYNKGMFKSLDGNSKDFKLHIQYLQQTLKKRTSKEYIDSLKKSGTTIEQFRKNVEAESLRNENIYIKSKKFDDSVLKEFEGRSYETEKFIKKAGSYNDGFYYTIAFIGGVFMTIGIYNWEKQQKFQDEILKFQRDTIELEYKAKLKGIDKTKYRKP